MCSVVCVSTGLTYPPPTAATAAAAGSACVVNSHETFPLGIQFAGQRYFSHANTCTLLSLVPHHLVFSWTPSS